MADFDSDIFTLVTEIAALSKVTAAAADSEAAKRKASFESSEQAVTRVLQRAADASRGKLFHRGDEGTEHWRRHALGFTDNSGRALLVEIRANPPEIKLSETEGGTERPFDFDDDSVAVENRIEAAVYEYLTSVRARLLAATAPH